MSSPPPSSVTQILQDYRNGDEAALDRLLPLVYAELRSLADGYMRAERADHTLQATALVHEAYLRLAAGDLPWSDRAHFFAIAARTMRRILVDHARERAAVKRGGQWVRTTLDEGIVLSGAPPLELVRLDEAMAELAEQDDRAAKAAELHWFAGLSYEDTARALEVSPATVHRDLRMARAWIYRALDVA
ncbi:MAG: RNA polymerase subunit sigma-70 [Gemmatimonadetes bacterium]|nr:RNA polymerase subunit sigma-70 [Gemmatimonadota bacterium]